ncbi:MAG: hypothetical protein KDD36_04755 [Flavobacteriales bacterium]|nr:hypothetical protein [Flavobacteriales bacterium]
MMRSTLFIFLFAGLFVSCTSDREEVPQIEVCDTLSSGYNANVKPIIQSNCAVSGCHQGSFQYGDFTKYSVVKSKVDQGTFRQKVLITKEMPPSGTLNDIDLQILTCWVNKGAPNN